MLKNYLKIAFRNLWKNRGYTAINMGGLAIGLAGFIMLLLYVNYEKSYDTWSPQLKKVYQVNEMNTFMSDDDKGSWNDLCDSRVGPVLRNSLPGIDAITIVAIMPEKVRLGITANNRVFSESRALDSDSSFFKVFPYPFIYGNRDHALDKLHSMVVTAALAKKWFGTTDVLGRTVKLKWWIKDDPTVYEITGVVKKPDMPSILDFDLVTRSGNNDKGMDDPQSTHYANLFIKARAGQDMAALDKQANRVYVTSLSQLLKARNTSLADYKKEGKRFGIQLEPLQYVHLHPLDGKSVMDKLSPALLLSVLLLLVAIINFANLATAQVMQRGREVGVRKVLGANRKALVFQFMLEVTMQCVASLLISLLLVELALPMFNKLFDTSLSLLIFHHSVGIMWWQLMVIVLTIILLSGLYPAFFMAGYDPVKVLKGSMSRGGKGVAIRNTLIVVQFLIAVVFISGAGIIMKQVNYMVHTDLGFQPDGLLNLNASHNKQLVDRIKTVPGVKYVGTNSQLMGNSMDFVVPIKYDGETKSINVASVNMETFNAMDVKLKAGRLFSKQYGQDTVNTVILNESAAKILGGNVVGKSLYENDSVQKLIVGVIADYHYAGFDQKVLPTIYAVIGSKGPSAFMNNLLVRVNAKDYDKTLAGIQQVWSSLYPDFPLQYSFMQDNFHKVIADDLRFKKIVNAFTWLSLLLSLVGIFALSAFITARRTKEISIRKVLGASLPDILQLLNRSFVILVIIANLVAWPIAYLLAKHWLNGFAYRINIPVWPFIAATVLSIVLTIVTVCIQSWKAANISPAEALKYE